MGMDMNEDKSVHETPADAPCESKPLLTKKEERDIIEPGCECGTCDRARRTLRTVEGRMDAPPKNLPQGPTFRHIAAIAHRENPLTAEEADEGKALLKTYTAARKRGEVVNGEFAPGHYGLNDIAVVANFLACCEDVLKRQSVRLMKSEAGREQTKRMLVALSDFERFFVTPAAISLEDPGPSQEEIDRLIKRLFGVAFDDVLGPK
jgi:hypothetical protein